MGVDVGGGGKVRMPKPLLNLLERYAVGKQEACAGVTKIVKAHLFETVTHKDFWKCRGRKLGFVSSAASMLKSANPIFCINFSLMKFYPLLYVENLL